MRGFKKRIYPGRKEAVPNVYSKPGIYLAIWQASSPETFASDDILGDILEMGL